MSFHTQRDLRSIPHLPYVWQYPHEEEILFAPLTGLEVRLTRIEGSVLVVTVALSVNLASLTIEQVIGLVCHLVCRPRMPP